MCLLIIYNIYQYSGTWSHEHALPLTGPDMMSLNRYLSKLKESKVIFVGIIIIVNFWSQNAILLYCQGYRFHRAFEFLTLYHNNVKVSAVTPCFLHFISRC